MVANTTLQPSFRITMVFVFIVSLGFLILSLITYTSFDTWAYLDKDWPRSDGKANLAKAKNYLVKQKEPLRLAWAYGVIADDYLSKENQVRALEHYQHELNLLEDYYEEFTSKRIIFVLSRLILLGDTAKTTPDEIHLRAKLEDHKRRQVKHFSNEITIQKQGIRQNHLPKFVFVHLGFFAFLCWAGLYKKMLFRLTSFLTLLGAYYSLPMVMAFMIDYWSPYATQIKFHSNTYLGLALVSGSILLFPNFYKFDQKTLLQKRAVLKEIVIGVGSYAASVCIVVIILMVIGLAGLFDMDGAEIRNAVRRGDARSTWQMIVATCLLVPIIEEVIFRGILFNALAKRFSIVSTVFLSSAFFVLIHPFGPEWPVYFIVGIALAMLMKWRKTITGCISFHITANCIAIFT